MSDSPVDHDTPDAARSIGNLKVLVIDARAVTRWTVTLVLGSAGASVTCADSLAEAFALLAVRPFDAILTDVELPGLGWQRGRPVLAGIAGPNAGAPVIAITDHAQSDAAEVSHAAGMVMEIGGFIDPARICRELEGLTPNPPRAAAA